MPKKMIWLHTAAPRKPQAGQACNGCGVCCAAQPCPLGMLLSRNRHGACHALLWDEAATRYHCGVVAQPRRWLPWLPARLARRLALRWIAAAHGCDSNLEAV